MFNPIKEYVIYLLAGLLAALALTYGIHTMYLKATISSQKGTIEEQTGKISRLEDDLTTAKEANLKLSTEITLQNKAIDAMQQEADRKQREADEALAKAKVSGERYKRLYGSLLADPPRHPDDLCLSLSERLDSYVATRRGE